MGCFYSLPPVKVGGPSCNLLIINAHFFVSAEGGFSDGFGALFGVFHPPLGVYMISVSVVLFGAPPIIWVVFSSQFFGS